MWGLKDLQVNLDRPEVRVQGELLELQGLQELLVNQDLREPRETLVLLVLQGLLEIKDSQGPLVAQDSLVPQGRLDH